MRDGDPFPFWLVQHPSSAAGHQTTVGMARSQAPGYNFHRTRLPQPRKQNRLWPLWPSGPLHHSLACPETPSLARPAGLSCSRPGSRTVKGQGKGRGNQGIIAPLPCVCSSSSATAAQGNAPAVGTESGHPQQFRAGWWSMRCAGERLAGIHRHSSMEPAVGIFLPGGAGARQRETGSLTKDLEPQVGTFPSRFTLWTDYAIAMDTRN